MLRDNALLKKLNESVWFEEAFCFFMTILALLLWKFSGEYGVIAIALVAVVTQVFFNDFKYMIPCVLTYIFSFNLGLKIDSFPLIFIITSCLFVIYILYRTIRNGICFKKCKTWIGLAGLAVSCFIPIFYNSSIIPSNGKILYFFYFLYLLYFIIYLLFTSSLNKNSFRMLVVTFSYLAIMISGQMIISAIEKKLLDPSKSILDNWYYIGWGHTNEVGIMIITFIPATFLLIAKSKTTSQVLMNMAKLLIVPLALVLCASRGALIFGSFEIVALGITALCFAKKKGVIAITAGVIFTLALIFIQMRFGLIPFSKKVLGVFLEFMDKNGSFIHKLYTALNPTGRKELWSEALDVYTESPVKILFGNGFVYKFWIADDPAGGQSYIFKVAHSTAFETLAAFGSLGMIFMIIHLCEKYLHMTDKDKSITYIMGFGFGIIDIYGALDNTYSMWYFMIPLVIMLAALDNLPSRQIIEIY